MSINLSNSAVTKFDDMVKQQYQAIGRLRNTVTLRNNVTGLTYEFARMGKGTANQKATQADVTPMNVAHGRQVATLQRWLAAELTDIFDKDEVNFDEMAELTKVIAGALGRREDQLIIDIANAGTYSASPAVGDADTGLVIAEGSANMTVGKLRQVNARFQDLEIDNNKKHISMTSSGLHSLLADAEVTNTDFAAVKALVGGEVDSYLGMKFHIIGSRTEGGLPVATNIVSAFAWHEEAIGLAVGNIDKMTKVGYIDIKTSWLTTGFLRAGAAIRENAGIIQIDYDQTA